jgi:hypothetical protein
VAGTKETRKNRHAGQAEAELGKKPKLGQIPIHNVTRVPVIGCEGGRTWDPGGVRGEPGGDPEDMPAARCLKVTLAMESMRERGDNGGGTGGGGREGKSEISRVATGGPGYMTRAGTGTGTGTKSDWGFWRGFSGPESHKRNGKQLQLIST